MTDAREALVALIQATVSILRPEAERLADAILAAGYERDEYHTLAELYEYRMLYNAHAARGWLAAGIPVVKSRRHSDGEPCFGGGWFIVVATLPSGQVSNHYRDEHWSLFDVPEVDLPPEYDGHTPQVAAERLRDSLAAGWALPGERVKPSEEDVAREEALAAAWESAQERYPGADGLSDANKGAFIVGWCAALEHTSGRPEREVCGCGWCCANNRPDVKPGSAHSVCTASKHHFEKGEGRG